MMTFYTADKTARPMYRWECILDKLIIVQVFHYGKALFRTD